MAGVIGVGSRIASVRCLRLGNWHVNHAIDVVDGSGRTHRLVLRRWARPDWEAEDPDYTVERELRVLALLRAGPVRAPAVIAADPAGVQCDVPAILLTRLSGHPPRLADSGRDDFCRQLADTLAQIHEVNGAVEHQLDAYRLYYDRAAATPARWMPNARVASGNGSSPRAAAADGYDVDPPRLPPENTLWSRGHLTGVVDWTQASWGPPGMDLGHMRWNLVADHGQRVADRFLECYRATTGIAHDDQPYWDLVSLLDLLLDGDDPGDIEPEDLRRFEEYAKTALATRT